jgi:protein-tyrosine phosphatase
MTAATRWALVAGIIFIVVVMPIVYYRSVYTYGKRLREVVPGRLYRSGQMTADGFIDTLQRLKIRTVINVQDDFPDPDLDESFWSSRTIKESELCQQLGVHYEFIAPDLVPLSQFPAKHPQAIDRFLDLLDDESNYPILLHCKAGLHRTGVLTAVYRMEYQGWTPAEAFRELRAHGFGSWVGTSSNLYVNEYVLNYRPRAVADHDPARAQRTKP